MWSSWNIELPKSGSGKVLKRLLSERFWLAQNVLSAEINLGPERLNFIQQMAGYPAP